MRRVPPYDRRATRSWRLLVAGGAALLGIGCTADVPPDPPPGDDPQGVASALAAGLARRDVRAVDFTGPGATAANQALQALTQGMGPRRPEVAVGPIETTGETATAVLRLAWTFPGVAQPWTYETRAPLVRESGRWKAQWQPTVVEGGLTAATRLSMRRRYPERGELLGGDGDRIVTLRPVVRIGIDKAGLPPARAARSAARLARLVDIDAKRYVDTVAEAGPEAFVEAIVFRADDEERPANRVVSAIPGALAIDGEQMLAPDRDFARPVIGTVGEATEETVEASGGAVVAGDQVGLSGLQRRYDEVMRGTPGVLVQRVALTSPGAGSAASPRPSASASPGTAPVTVYQVAPVAGRDLTTTLNVFAQRLAERTLAGTKPPAALVALRPSTGEVLAAANNEATKGQSLATVGQFPPGSTFKVATALALLRAGLEPGSRVSCPRTLTVDGRRFTNYGDYPSSALGTIDLRIALAQSCNTAFLGEQERLDPAALASAAASLGLGVDYDVGFASFFGSVPADPSATGRAAALIGQGKVQASPLAMAAVAASVTEGLTVVPRLVEGQQAEPKAAPLTAAEARELKGMMAAVVEDGSARFLADVPGPQVLAKTGTAEYGEDTPPRTHAWMIGTQGDLAVAVFVADGDSGSRTAGPLLERFLRGMR